jgi:Lon protease-like protein
VRVPTSNVPIFPLATVLFPEGVLPLRIFEPRYLDMVSTCLKEDKPFGVCLIADGTEVGPVAKCFPVGTLAKIINWNQSPDGILEVEAVGCQRFRLLKSDVAKQNLLRGTIQLLNDSPPVTLPKEFNTLVMTLKDVMNNASRPVITNEESFTDPNWVSYRLIEMLSMETVMRQRLLEIDDAVERLHIILGLYSNIKA